LIKKFPQNGKVILCLFTYNYLPIIFHYLYSKSTDIYVVFVSAWLRYRRNNAPTQNELLTNLAISDMKKTNSKKVALENPFVKEEADEILQAPQFPVYSEYQDPNSSSDDKSNMRFKPL